MKNILFIIPDLTQTITGSSKRSSILSKHLSRNWRIIIISRKKILELVNNEVISEKNSTFFNVLKVLVSIRFSFWFCDFIKWALIPIPNLIFTLHDMKEWTEFSRKGILKKFLLYVVLKKSKYLITVSEDQRILIKQKLGIDCHVFPNAVSQKWLEHLSTVIKNNKRVGDKYIIYVSNFTKHKRHLDLINNNPLLDRYKFVFVGSAIDEGGLSIKNAIVNHPNVEIYENILESKLRDLVNGSSFVVFPSHYEGYGMPILESIALNKRVLISDKLTLKHFDDCALVRSISFENNVSDEDIKWADSPVDYYENNCHCLIGWDKVSNQIHKLLLS
jgi:glycosyltransferase involved in cell wall biosynthesis